MNIDFTLTINHYFPDGKSPASTLADLLSQMEKRIVSQISDAIAALKASADATTTRVNAEQTALQAMITSLQSVVATLQEQVNSGGGSQADLDALAAIKDQLDVLDKDQPGPTPSPTPTPEPTPTP